MMELPVSFIFDTGGRYGFRPGRFVKIWGWKWLIRGGLTGCKL